MLWKIFHKTIFTMPILFLVFVLCIKNLKWRWVYLLAALSIFLFFKNPIIEHRNGFGAAYFLVAWAIFSNVLSTNKRLIFFIFLVMIIGFPLGELLAPHRLFNIDSFYSLFFNVYDRIAFDSWANVIASIHFASDQGLAYGKQLVSGILFWIPREFWDEKSISSGEMLGQYLSDYNGLWLTNISFPIVAEAYIDFWYFGVIVYAFFLALASNIIDSLISTKSKLLFLPCLYFSFSIIFLLRGPFLSSIAFIIGGMIGCFLVSYISAKSEKG